MKLVLKGYVIILMILLFVFGFSEMKIKGKRGPDTKVSESSFRNSAFGFDTDSLPDAKQYLNDKDILSSTY